MLAVSIQSMFGFSPLKAKQSDQGRRDGKIISLLIFLLALGLRLATAAVFPTEWDSVNFVFGVDRFDVTQGAPHAPGYWLYVAAARLLRALTPLDAHQSLVVLAALASSATVALVYLVGREMAGPWLGFTAAGFVLANPFAWFYGSSVATYSFDALVAVVLMMLALRARPHSSHGLWAALVLGLGAGFRPTSLIVLGPLALIASLRSVRNVRQAAAVASIGLVAIAVWLIPMSFDQPGGWEAIRAMNSRTWIETGKRTSVFYGAAPDAVRNNLGQATGYTVAALNLLIPLGLAGLLILAASRSWTREIRKATPPPFLAPWVVLTVAVMPAILFMLLIHFGKAGYVLAFLPAAVLALLLPVARLGTRLRWAALVVVIPIVLLNGQRFLMGAAVLPERWRDGELWLTKDEYGAPYPLTHHAIRRVDDDTRAYLSMRQVFSPRTDVLVYVWMNGAHRYRHAMFTLPEFIAHMVRIEKGDENIARNFKWTHEYDYVIEVPPGGKAVFVLDVPTPEVLGLTNQGGVEEVSLPTGPRVWVAQPGIEMFGMTIQESAAANSSK